MTIVKKNELTSFLANRLNSTNVVLVYGPNSDASNEVFKSIVKSACPNPDDPFLTASVSEDMLKDNPGLLLDEALALSLTGDRKVITCLDPGPYFRKQLELLLKSNHGQTNLVVARAGELKASSSLRKICEKSPNTAAIPCYEDTPNELAHLVRTKAGELDKAISSDNVRLLVNLCDCDRGLVLSELDKLVLYVGDRSQIEHHDITTLCEDKADATLDRTIDAMLLGDTSTSVQLLQELKRNGMPTSVFLDAMSNYLIRFLNWRLDTDDGVPVDQVLKTARPPVFFKRHRIIAQQLGLWSASKISQAQKVIHSATELARKNADISEQIVERVLLNLSRLPKMRQ